MPVQPIQRRSARILFDTEFLDDGWHPLDGVPAPEYVPPTWDGPHVGKRLVNGLRTLRLMPRVAGPQAWGSAWPKYAHDWTDLLAQQEADEADKQRAQHEAESHPVEAELGRYHALEQCDRWPARYLRDCLSSCAPCRWLPSPVTRPRHGGCGAPAAAPRPPRAEMERRGPRLIARGLLAIG